VKNELSFCPSCGASIEKDKDTYCPFCGAPTKTEKKAEKPVTDYLQTEVEFPAKPMEPIAAPGGYPTGTSYPAAVAPDPQGLPQLEIRSFWMWTLLGIVTFGIASFIYLYYNIEDLNKLDQYPKPAGVPSTRIDTSNMLIIVLIGFFTGFISIIMLIATYMKFEKLYKYVQAHPQRQQTMPVSGGRLILTSIISSFCLGILSFGIYLPILIIPEDPMLATMIVGIIGGVVGLIAIGFSIYMLTLSAKWQTAYNERARILCPGTPEKSM